MLSILFTIFFGICVFIFLFALYYSHFIKQAKKLESNKKEWYNENNEEVDKVSPNQR